MKEKLINYWTEQGIVTNRAIVNAFRKVPREDFLLEHWKSSAYQDIPLPIGHEQTISQPTTVAIMLEALELASGMKVLELGTGSGWNAALMSCIVGKTGKVITTEIVPELVRFAKSNIKKLKLANVEVVQVDGSCGWQEEAPYDRIICTAAAPRIPSVLVEQLKDGGIMVIPVGPLYSQHMIKAKKSNKKLVTEDIGDFVFVPLKGRYGF